MQSPGILKKQKQKAVHNDELQKQSDENKNINLKLGGIVRYRIQQFQAATEQISDNNLDNEKKSSKPTIHFHKKNVDKIEENKPRYSNSRLESKTSVYQTNVIHNDISILKRS